MKQKVLRDCRRYAGPAPAARLARSADRLITACQEWLEVPDRPPARLTALAVIMASVVYMAIHLVVKVFRGG